MKVAVHLKQTSQEILHENVQNTYQKGDFYCVWCYIGKEGLVYKYPVNSIFRVIETYISVDTVIQK